MIKMLVLFFMLTCVVALSIIAFRSSTGKERWKFAKVFGFAACSALVASLILAGIVILF